MLVLALISLSIVSGILYRMGGSDDYSTKFRDFGVPSICATTFFLITNAFNTSFIWHYLIFWLLCFGSLTTYFKKEGVPAKWWNWMFCGIAWGLAAIPLAFVTKSWIGFAYRLILLTIWTPIWCIKFNKPLWKFQSVVVNEFGRGLFINASIPLLLIGV